MYITIRTGYHVGVEGAAIISATLYFGFFVIGYHYQNNQIKFTQKACGWKYPVGVWSESIYKPYDTNYNRLPRGCVGNTSKYAFYFMTATVHPHVCGEYIA